MERAKALFGKATFVMDRGYDDNKMFLKIDELGQDYVIRLTAKRKLYFHGKWIPATQLRNQRKGKIKTSLIYKGKRHDAYLSHVKVQITASQKDIYFVLVYGITEHPMMLATNKPIRLKEDVIAVAKHYFSRWKIEEYFRSKKQLFQFENFRVRKLSAINALNFLYYLMHGISGSYFHETRNQCPKGCNHTNCRFYKRKSIFLLLPVSERYLRHTIVCKRRRQTLVPDKTSGIPSTLP